MKRLLFFLASAALLFAQQTPPPPVQSPDVQSDGRVTFRVRAPDAQKVKLNLEGAKESYMMQKDEHGVWSVTTGPLAPELYGYSFNLDGVRLLDPSNSAIIPNLLSPSSMLHVPGPSPMPWEDSDIAHGTVHHHFYNSAIIGDNRDFYVYTPPGYDQSGSRQYPVLYLLHGYSDDASAWTSVGKANLILDWLLAQSKIVPMLVVMPLGYGAPEIVEPATAAGHPFNHAELRDKNFHNFTAALIDELIPQVERMYKTRSDRDSRAIAGLSMGGAETLLTGLNRLDKFSWIGSFSAGGLGGDLPGAFPQLGSSANSQIHLLWIACGRDDRLIQPNRDLIAWLKTKDIHLTAIETPGMHTWQVWRDNLINFAPLLFHGGQAGVGAAITAPEQ
jgi:enterochelin esterase-like enzyme